MIETGLQDLAISAPRLWIAHGPAATPGRASSEQLKMANFGAVDRGSVLPNISLDPMGVGRSRQHVESMGTLASRARRPLARWIECRSRHAQELNHQYQESQ
ncbi:hypothetical protein ACVBEG_27045 [Pseudomonas sp. GG8]